MPDFSLVPVEHQPDFSDVSLIPVDHDPFSADGATRPAQPLPAQNQPARPPQQPATGPDLPDVGAPLIGDGGQFSPGVPWANKAADIASKFAGNTFRGAINLAATPGAIMQPNPYPPGSEEAFWYDDQRQQLINKSAPAMAFAMLGAGAPMAESGAVGALGGKPLPEELAGQTRSQIPDLAADKGLVPGAKGVARGAAAAEERAAAIAKGELSANAPTGNFYSVLYETKLKPTSYPGRLRPAHNQEGNENLLQEMEGDDAFARGVQNQSVILRRTPTGLEPQTPPAGFSWHHAKEPGVLQLVPREQHDPGSIFQGVLHPDGRGGYSKWGK
jgi:HNH/ENDO VII superfamily nuclease